MAGGFFVDLAALRAAADGIITTMDEMATHDVEATVPAHDAVGDDRLAEALRSFGVRWQIGVTNLMKDVDAVAQSLAGSLDAYVQTDEAATAGLGGPISRASGNDPGVP